MVAIASEKYLSLKFEKATYSENRGLALLHHIHSAMPTYGINNSMFHRKCIVIHIINEPMSTACAF